MPLEIEIRSEERLVITRWIGSMGDRDLIDADDEFRKNPAIKPEFDQLADLTLATEGGVSRQTLQVLTTRAPAFSNTSRRAFVAPSDVTFGMARMFEQMRGEDAGEIRIFRSMEEAEKWLADGRISGGPAR